MNSMENCMKLSRYASLPLIMAIPVAWVAAVFTLTFGIAALIPSLLDERIKMLGAIFFSFIIPFLFIAVPLMSFVLRKSKKNRVEFTVQSVLWDDCVYSFGQYTLIYYAVRPHNFFCQRPGTLALRMRQSDGAVSADSESEIEVGSFTGREVKRLMKMGLAVEIC